jgi:plastocyanin
MDDLMRLVPRPMTLPGRTVAIIALLVLALALGAVALSGGITRAATIDVVAGPDSVFCPVSSPDNVYCPADITINVGDTIRWTQAPGAVPHDVREFTTGAWGARSLPFTKTFNTPGVAVYFCSLHVLPPDKPLIKAALDTNGDGQFTIDDHPSPEVFSTWMVGRIIVAAPPTATPTITDTAVPDTTPAITNTPTSTSTPTVTDTPSITPTPTPTPTFTPTVTPTPAPNTETVDMGNFFFAPKHLTVRVGDTVRWVNNSDVPHNATSDSGVWDSGFVDPGGAFVVTFNAVGTYAYRCTIHVAQGQVGTIIVEPEVTPSATPSAGPSPTLTQTATPPALPTEPPTGVNVVLGEDIAARAPLTVEVAQDDFSFLPRRIIVNAGDTVRWVNRGAVQHNTTADGGLWASKLMMDPGEVFSVTFTEAGTYTYTCTLHAPLGQVGAVVVRPFGSPDRTPSALPIVGSGPPPAGRSPRLSLLAAIAATGAALLFAHLRRGRGSRGT